MSLEPKIVYSRAKLAARIAAIGKQVSKDYAGRTVDAVIILEDAFVFAADLLRSISRPVVCHFVRLELRDVELSGFSRREVFFSRSPESEGAGYPDYRVHAAYRRDAGFPVQAAAGKPAAFAAHRRLAR